MALQSSLALSWDGPPPPIGGGLISLNRPTSYLDATSSGMPNASAPFNSRLRLNAVVSESGQDTYQINFKAEDFQFQNVLPLGATGVNAPTNLWGFDIGGIYKHQIDSSHNWGLIVSGGSDSDIPFNSLSEVDANMTGTYNWKVDSLHEWVFLLNYSKTRSFAPGLPLPGAGYFVVYPESHLQVFYGIPFFFGWQPSEKWRVMITYFLLTFVSSEIDYKISPDLKIYSGFQWTSQTWLRANRPDSTTEIIFDQKKLNVGISKGLGENLFANISGGFAFDQRVTEATSILSSNLVYSYLPAGGFAMIELANKF